MRKGPPLWERYSPPMAASTRVRLIHRLRRLRDSLRDFRKVCWKYWYRRVTRALSDDEVLFINWAYEEDPPMALPLAASDEADRLHIQLYYRIATQADIAGKEVLEVSCGHGGGASYLSRTLHPASYTGLDLNPAGIALCRERHNLPGLDFVQGDAENLPFADQSFDVVLNVEASHCYPRFPRFLDEVVRVLRPGGHFLYADIRLSDRVAEWEAELAATPLRLLSQAVINVEVVRGMEERSQRSLDLIDHHMPWFLRPYGREFAGVPGSQLYRKLRCGEITYQMYCLAKD